jgi:plasmid replication initiation protein
MAESDSDRELIFDLQPSRHSVIWQHNAITDARYKLSARQQKLLLYAIAMIEPAAEEFGKIKIGIKEFAELTGLGTANLYHELRETAIAIREAPLVVDNILEPGMKRPQRRHSSWFEYVDEVPDGTALVTVKFTNWLKPYLLQVRREFFQFQLGFAIHLSSEYAIRLYQYLKRWEFAKRRAITIDQLRLEIGATEVDRKGKIVRINLEQYKHFKSRAIAPAVKEINQETDLHVSYTETKFPRSKAVQSITFTIHKNLDNLDKLRPVTLPDRPQLEFPLRATKGEPTLEPGAKDALAGIAKEFGLSKTQELALGAYAVRDGLQYLLDKAEIVRSQPRTNSGRAFLAALRDDWQPPKSVPDKKPPKPKREEPPGWREWVHRKYPSAELPGTYRLLESRFPSVAAEFSQEMKNPTLVEPEAPDALPHGMPEPESQSNVRTKSQSLKAMVTEKLAAANRSGEDQNLV